MENEVFEISFFEKFWIWVRWNLYLLGTLLIVLSVQFTRSGLPTMFKSIELAQVNERVDQLGMAMSEVQDVQVSQAQKAIRLAKK